jgi:hypothetical protein
MSPLPPNHFGRILQLIRVGEEWKEGKEGEGYNDWYF